MATATNKQKLINQVFTALGKGRPAAEPADRPVLEQFIYALCREGTTRAVADEAFDALKTRFFDWNEVRVSSAEEIADALAGLPDPEVRAQRVIDFLHEVFETTFSFDLDGLQKKGLKQAAKQLSRYKAASDYTVAWVTQQGLGGHAIPLDAPALAVLRRLGVLEDGTDVEALRTALEHLVPKAKGPLFVDVVSELAAAACDDTEPPCCACPVCQLAGDAPAVVAVSKKPR